MEPDWKNLTAPTFGDVIREHARERGESIALRYGTRTTTFAEFDALTRLVTATPAIAMDYPDSATAIDVIEDLWAAL